MNSAISTLRRRAAALTAAGLLGAGAAQAAQPIIGVWQADVQRIDCATGAVVGSFQGLQVFHAGGTLTDTNSGNPATRGPGMGRWSGRNGVYQTRFRFMRYDAGIFAGYAVVTRTIVLDPSGTSATASATSEVLDAAGNLIATGCTLDSSVKVD